MKLVNAYDAPDTWRTLYDLLAERPPENRISHERMPTWREHVDFIKCKPFRFWYALEAEVQMAKGRLPVLCYVGALEATLDNEIGVAIFEEYRGRGLATEAISLFMKKHKPLPPIPAIRNGHWLANIATENEKSKEFFKKLGFKPIQETWCLHG